MALAAALLSIVTLALLLASTEVCGATQRVLDRRGFRCTRSPETTSHFLTESNAADLPGELSAKLQQTGKSAVRADYVLGEREQQLTTIDAAFAFVRDKIGFESYSGAQGGRMPFRLKRERCRAD